MANAVLSLYTSFPVGPGLGFIVGLDPEKTGATFVPGGNGGIAQLLGTDDYWTFGGASGRQYTIPLGLIQLESNGIDVAKDQADANPYRVIIGISYDETEQGGVPITVNVSAGGDNTVGKLQIYLFDGVTPNNPLYELDGLPSGTATGTLLLPGMS